MAVAPAVLHGHSSSLVTQLFHSTHRDRAHGILPGPLTAEPPRNGTCSEGRAPGTQSLPRAKPEVLLVKAVKGKIPGEANISKKQWWKTVHGLSSSPGFSSDTQFLLDCPELMAEVAVKSTAEGGGTAALTVSVLSPQLRGHSQNLRPFFQ